MPKFTMRADEPPAPESPEVLFRSLRPTDAGVRHLWAHQADLLRDYHALSAGVADVALELPTGGGKTLVGLLLADYSRRAGNHRVAYLCPTIQLARQAAAKAAGYGITAVTLTGTQAGYEPAAFTAYSRAQAVAITTYHGVFNINPRIDSAQTLVLDDSHAGEAAVADLWSVSAARSDGALYAALLAALVEALPTAFAERMHEEELDPWRRNEVELVPPDAVIPKADLLREIVTQYARDHNAYSGAMIADALGYCLMYVSWNEILIRPLIPPTSEHAPFASAVRRIYMSATLGSGGELERAFGVPSIHRLPVPHGWDEHGSGRRFFIFPGAAKGDEATDAFCRDAIQRSGRALVLAPSRRELERFENSCLPEDVTALHAPDVESSFDGFVHQPRSALLLANRYDGIDLPDESCRLIVLTGLPAATHLQERFLYERLKARRVLAERIRTRIVQGAGRCTRNPQDYAAVIVRGDLLTDFCARTENISAMHPELQAEVNFGLDNCENPGSDLGELLDSFLKQDRDWADADTDISTRTADYSRQSPPNSEELANAAGREVEAWRAVWRGDVDGAVRVAQEVADRLGGGEELRPYRCLWLYLAACWANELARSTGLPTHSQLAATLTREATGCSRTLAWTPRITLETEVAEESRHDSRPEHAAEKLKRLGIRGLAFEESLTKIERQLALDDATQFELGLQALGDLLGFEAVRPGGPAAPDGVWREEREIWFIFEAKTEASEQNPVNVAEVRQAGTHQDWVRNQLKWEEPKRAITALISSKSAVDPAAAAIAGETCLVPPDVVRALASRTFEVYREIRADARGLSDEQLEEAFANSFEARGLGLEQLETELRKRRLADG